MHFSNMPQDARSKPTTQTNKSLFYQLDAKILYFNTFITSLYMF